MGLLKNILNNVKDYSETKRIEKSTKTFTKDIQKRKIEKYMIFHPIVGEILKMVHMNPLDGIINSLGGMVFI